jgi:hypothetical protein
MPSILPANAQAVWNDLINAGATPVQAAGIMGNMLHETVNLDPELVAMDTNGQYSRGLVMWNDTGAGAGVNWSQYITGNVSNDLAAQVNLIKSQGGFAKAAGATPYDAGVNFAHTFEACAECGYPGTSQLPLRGGSATTVFQVAQSGNWSLGGGLPTPGVSPTPTTPPATPAAPVTVSFDPAQMGPLGEIQNVFAGFGGFAHGAEKAYKSFTALAAMLVAGETWIRLSEVALGVILGSAGLALIAITVAGDHPGAIADVVSLIPGEGQAARAAVGAAGGVRRGVTGAAAGGARAARAGRTSSRAPARRPAPALRPPSTAGAGAQARRATAAAAGTWRRAQADDEDEAHYQASKRARIENRRVARDIVGTPRRRPRDTSDLRRRTP